MVTRQLVGFGRGFAAPFGAIGSLARTPSTWPLALVPVALLVLIETSMGLGWWYVLKPWLNERLAGVGRFQNLLATAAAWASLAPLLLVGWSMVQVLSAPALERIVGIIERELGAPPRPPLGFFAELGCGLRSTLLSFTFTFSLILALTALELVASPLAVVTTPLKLLIGALGVAWAMFDYPLTLRGIGVRSRLRFMSRHFSAVLGFGAAFSLLFWLPCFGILMLPVGVVGATRLYWEIQRSA